MTPFSLTTLVRYLVYASPFLFPAYLLRFKIAGIPFTALEVFIDMTFILWCLSLFRPKKIYWKPIFLGYSLAVLLFLAGASWGVLSAPSYLTLPDGNLLDSSRVTWGVWKGWVMTPLLYLIVLTQSLTNREQVERALRSFIYSAVLVSVLSYGYGLWGEGFTYDLRLRGFYESANYLALYLAPALLLSFYGILHHPRSSELKKQHYGDIAAAAILSHALLFTQSYAAILAVFGALVLVTIVKFATRKTSVKKILMGIGSLVIVLLTLLITQWNSPKFQQFLEVENQSSTTVRFEIYQVTWALIGEHFWTGVGPGLFQARYQNKAPAVLGRPPMEWNIPHPHNLFFAFWLNAGFLGLIALLSLIVLVHRRFTYPLIAFWGIILHGFFDTPFWKNDLSMIFWLIIASILLLQSYGTSSPENHPHPAKG